MLSSHEMAGTIYQISTKAHCRRLASGREGMAGSRLLLRIPIGWLPPIYFFP